MTTRLVLVLDLDANGETDAERRAVGDSMVTEIYARAAAGAGSYIEWQASELIAVRIESDPS